MKWILILIMVLTNNLVSQNADKQKNSYNILVKDDIKNNKINIYLTNLTQLLDSTILEDCNFKMDSLLRFDKWNWLFIYSLKCGSGCKDYKQMIFSIKEDRIHFKLICNYISSYQISNLYSIDTNVRISNLIKYPYFKETITLTSSFIKKGWIEKYTYNGNKEDNGVGNRTRSKLKYDRKNEIYYNSTIFLNGEFIINEKKKEVAKLNGNFLCIEFDNFVNVYFEKKWYEYNKVTNRMIPLINC